MPQTISSRWSDLNILALAEKVGAERICGGHVGIADGECIGGIGGGRLGEGEQGPHHECHLLLAGAAAAHCGQFDAGGRVFHNLQPVFSRSQH